MDCAQIATSKKPRKQRSRMSQKKKNNGSNENGGNKKPTKKPQKGSLFDMIRGIRRGKTVEKRSIHDQIHGIGRKKSGGGFSVAAYMSGGMIMPAHHANTTNQPGVNHKGNLRRG